MKIDFLVQKGKAIIAKREEDAGELSPEFLEGFKEGVAGIIADLTGESANDILTVLTPEPKAVQFEASLEVSCHQVKFHYEIGTHELTDELKDALTEEAWQIAQSQIADGFNSGELDYNFPHDSETTIHGWWEIEKASK